MSNLITLEELHAESEKYCIYRRTDSLIAYAPHYHDYYQFCYVLSGQILHRQGKDSAIVNPGDVFLVPPGFAHSLRFTGENPEIYSLAFSESLFHADLLRSEAFRFLNDLQTNHDTGNIPLRLTPDKEQRSSMLALLECLETHQQTPCPPVLSAVPNLIISIIYLLAQCHYRNTNSHRYPWDPTNKGQLLRRCVIYIDTHFTQPLCTEDIAKHFGLSQSALCSAFQQYTNLSIHKYITQKRIQKAQMLIRSQPDLPLSDVCAEIGYEDSSTFYRNFKKETGLSPAKYKQMCQD